MVALVKFCDVFRGRIKVVCERERRRAENEAWLNETRETLRQKIREWTSTETFAPLPSSGTSRARRGLGEVGRNPP